MDIDKNTIKLIGELEFLIGSQCYNPNSYDGWNDMEGCEFRYPVCVPKTNELYTKVKSNINKTSLLDQSKFDEDTIQYMKYRFGSNELYIGQGLWYVLDFLEERYGLDFNKMEQNLANDKPAP